MFSYLLLAAILFDVYATFQASRSVPGTRQRYVWSSWRRGTSWVVNIAFVLQGLVYAAGGDFLFGGASLVIGVLNILMELKRDNDHDDWFSDTWNKLKSSFRARQHATAGA